MEPIPSFTRTFFFRDQTLGQQLVTPGEEPRVNVAYFCPCCGAHWGRIIHSDAVNTPLLRWYVEVRYCDLHMHQMWTESVAGCFFNVHKYPSCYTRIPTAVLRHDFLMHMLLREQLSGKTKA